MPTPHSPAPWTTNGTRVSDANGSEVCDVCIQQDNQLFDANRHLICAAPDLLLALKSLEAAQAGSAAWAQVWPVAVAAIRKAEGL